MKCFRRNAIRMIRKKVKMAEKRYSIQLLTYHVIYDLVEQDDLTPHLVFNNALSAGSMFSLLFLDFKYFL